MTADAAPRAVRIALTGGPGAGKTTAADLMRREVGERVVVVPETATMLFGGGFPRLPGTEARRAAQTAIFHVQRGLEDAIEAAYPGRVLLCDRGTIDGAAYWPDTAPDFFAAAGTTLEDELARYHHVIFFETAAVGGMSIEGGNPVRTEDTQAAVALDTALRELWSQHPGFVWIRHEASFLRKITAAVAALDEILRGVDP
jgi:predicted ATPase